MTRGFLAPANQRNQPTLLPLECLFGEEQCGDSECMLTRGLRTAQDQARPTMRELAFLSTTRNCDMLSTCPYLLEQTHPSFLCSPNGKPLCSEEVLACLPLTSESQSFLGVPVSHSTPKTPQSGDMVRLSFLVHPLISLYTQSFRLANPHGRKRHANICLSPGIQVPELELGSARTLERQDLKKKKKKKTAKNFQSGR